MTDDDGTKTAATVADPVGPAAHRARDALPTGTLVGRYVLVERIGAGGMGVVYAAYDPKLDRRIAIKLIRADGKSARAHDRLLREAQALAQLSHPNVVAVYDVGTYGDDVFLAMELVTGRSLRDVLAQRAPSLAERRRLVIGAGRGLAAAHRAGLVHRDVKPGNILVGDDGRALVGDFGLARAVADAEPSSGLGESTDDSSTGRTDARLRTPLTEHGTVIGTPRYMAPEALAGQAATPASDQFSFCITAFEALYSASPFQGADRAAIVDAIQHAPPRIPDGARVPKRLRRALLRGLSKDPAARFPSMDALLAELAAEPAVTPARALGAAAGVFVIGAAVWAASGRATSEPCRGASTALAGIWDDDRRAAVRTAFAGSSVPYAATTTARVEQVLDQYADAWVEMRTESCRATRVQGVQSEHLLDLRTACLDRRRQQLGALVTLFATDATPDLLKKATAAASSLPAISTCADADALTATVPPPEDPAVARDVEALRSRLDDGSALLQAGRYDRAVEAATPLATLADRLAYDPARAEAYRLLGEARSRSGAGKEAIAALREGILAAARGRDDRLAAEIWGLLVYALGQEARYDEALLARDGAEAAIDRAGGDPILRSTLLSNVGTILNQLERYAESEPLFAESIALRERAGRTDDYELGSALSNMGNTLSEQGRHDEARRFYDRAIAVYERVLGGDHPQVAIPHNNLGNSLTDQGEYAEAERHYRRAIEIWAHAMGPDFPHLAYPENGLGSMLEEQGRFDEAWPHFERAYELWRAQLGEEHPDVAMALFNLGSVRIRQGRHDDAEDYFRRALAIEEKTLEANHPSLSFPLAGLGECALARGQVAKALDYLERAWKIRTSVPSSPVERGSVALSLAKALDAHGDRARAHALATEARAALGDGATFPALRAELDAWLRAH